jgi:hypothetical protein
VPKIYYQKHRQHIRKEGEMADEDQPLPQGKGRCRTDQIRGIVLEISKLAIGYAIV